MAQDKKKHHFVPKSYLKGFAIEKQKSLIWEYDKKYSQISKNPKSVKKICFRDYYYEQITPDGQKTQMLEDGFGKIETTSIKIIRNLYERKTTVTGEEKGTLAYYIALLLTRGPAFRDGCNQIYKYSAEITLQKLYESGKLPEPPEILKEQIKNNDITSAVNAEVIPQVSIEHMLSIAKQFSESLCNKKWSTYFSKDKFFATSDTPVIFGRSSKHHEDVGPAHPTSLVFFPLNKYMLLAVRPYICSDEKTCDLKDADTKMIDLLNQIICYASQRYVYFSEKSDKLLEYIKSSQGLSQKLRIYKFGDAIIQKWNVDKNNSEINEHLIPLV